MSLPSFTGDIGIAPALEEVIGRPDERAVARWESLLQGGSRTGHKFGQEWASLKADAQERSAFLEEDLDGKILCADAAPEMVPWMVRPAQKSPSFLSSSTTSVSGQAWRNTKTGKHCQVGASNMLGSLPFALPCPPFQVPNLSRLWLGFSSFLLQPANHSLVQWLLASPLIVSGKH